MSDLQSVVEWFGEPDVGLMMLIILTNWIRHGMLGSRRRDNLRSWSRRISASSALAFVLYGLADSHPQTPEHFLALTIRAILFNWLILGVSGIALAFVVIGYESLVTPVVESVEESSKRRRIRREDRQRERNREEAIREAEKARQRPGPPVPEPLPREERIRLAVQQAKVDHDSKCTLLRSVGFDADELEVALLDEQTAHVRRIKEIMRG